MADNKAITKMWVFASGSNPNKTHETLIDDNTEAPLKRKIRW